MYGKWKLGAGLSAFSSCADRFCMSGYGRGGKTTSEMVALAAQVEGLDGLELVGNWHINDANFEEVCGLLRRNGLTLSMITVDLWTQEKWGRGSLAAADPDTRRAAVAEVKKCMDLAAAAGCSYVNVWPGQDGFDYSFQADYSEAWKWMRDGIAECAGHSSKVKVLVEYKIKEPRTHCFLNSAAKLILLIQGIENAGCLLDVGHSLAAGENVAEAAALLADHGVLDYLHLNDNYKCWDDDMIVASVHVTEYLEFIYWLLRLGYTGWLTLDIFPYREHKVPAANESLAWLRSLIEIVEAKGLAAITEIVRRGEGTDSVRLAREMLLAGPR
jgi:sugar phosphate isomerase/epimerase